MEMVDAVREVTGGEEVVEEETGLVTKILKLQEGMEIVYREDARPLQLKKEQQGKARLEVEDVAGRPWKRGGRAAIHHTVMTAANSTREDEARSAGDVEARSTVKHRICWRGRGRAAGSGGDQLGGGCGGEDNWRLWRRKRPTTVVQIRRRRAPCSQIWRRAEGRAAAVEGPSRGGAGLLWRKRAAAPD